MEGMKSGVQKFPLLLVPILIGFAVMIGYFAFDGYYTLWRFFDGQRRFQTTEGTITQNLSEAQTDSEGHTSYKVTIEFRYAVDGREYTSTQRTFEGIRVSLDQDDAAAIQGRYAIGEPATVHYDPDDPADAVLETEIPPIRWLIGGVAVVFTAFDALLVYVIIKRLQMAMGRDRDNDGEQDDLQATYGDDVN